MNDNIFLIVVIFFITIACIWYKLLYKLEEETRKKLQEEHEILIVKYNHMKVRLKRKKELLEVQDTLLEQTHNVYAVFHKCSGMIHGCFYDKSRAELFINGNVNLFIKLLEIE